MLKQLFIMALMLTLGCIGETPQDSTQQTYTATTLMPQQTTTQEIQDIDMAYIGVDDTVEIGEMI